MKVISRADQRKPTLKPLGEEKKCGHCRDWKPLGAFYIKPDGRPTSWCRGCSSIKNKEYRDANDTPERREKKRLATAKRRASDPERARLLRLRYRLKKYDISVEFFEALLASQGGHCALCPSSTGLVVDHDHPTGRVRGILCIACNTAIGRLGDSVVGLRRALDYLQDASPLDSGALDALIANLTAATAIVTSGPHVAIKEHHCDHLP